jgi:uncharacterized membrane protein
LKKVRDRRWEVDCLRGVAISLMLISNFLFDLVYFAGQTQLQSGLLDWFARFVAGTFIAVAGVSLTLSQPRPDSRVASPVMPESDLVQHPGQGFARVLRRGFTLLGLGAVVSGATWLVAGNQMVIFGVLHLIGAGRILAYPFLGHPRLSFMVGLLVMAAATVTSRLRLAHSWFLWLGLQPHDFISVDYTPLIPWFGVMLIGVTLGTLLYPGGQPRWQVPDFSRAWPIRPLSWCGRRSLLIYFVHQPILLAGIALTRKWW